MILFGGNDESHIQMTGYLGGHLGIGFVVHILGC